MRSVNIAARLEGIAEPGGVCISDAVAKDIVVIDDNVTDVDADAKFDPLDLRHRSTLLSHTALEMRSSNAP